FAAAPNREDHGVGMGALRFPALPYDSLGVLLPYPGPDKPASRPEKRECVFCQCRIVESSRSGLCRIEECAGRTGRQAQLLLSKPGGPQHSNRRDQCSETPDSGEPERTDCPTTSLRE